MDVDKIFKEGMDQLGNMPERVRKAAEQIKKEDIKCSDLMKQIDKKVAGFAKASKKMSREQKAHHISVINTMYEEAEAIARKKVELATSLYDAVDNDIAKIDKTTKKLEAGSGRHSEDEPSTSDGRSRKKKRKVGERDLDDGPGMNVPVVEMPVDPNEPVYCTCHQVSFGEMVCCDNSECKVEWFHFQCVGMTSGPPTNVKWFCETCRPNYKSIPNQWNYETNEPPKNKGGRKHKEEVKDE